MKQKNAVALLGALAIGVFLYKLANPKCKRCDVALKVIAVGQALVCPRCNHVFASAFQALIA